MCSCDICLNPEQHAARRRISDSRWATLLAYLDNHNHNHRSLSPGCDYCEGRKRQTVDRLPDLVFNAQSGRNNE